MMNKAARISLYIERDAYGNFYWCDNTGCYRIPTDDGDGGDGGDGDDGDGDGDGGDGGGGDGNDCYDADGCACNDTQCQEDKVLALFDFYATDRDWKSETDINESTTTRRVRRDYWECVTSLTYSIYSVEKVTETLFQPDDLKQRWKLDNIIHDKYVINGFYAGVNVSVSGDFDVLEMTNFTANTLSHVTLSCTGSATKGGKSFSVNINKVFPNIKHTFFAINSF